MFAVTGKYGRPSSFGERGALEQDRHRLLGADHRDRDDRHARAHRDLDEAAAPEAAQLVALAEALARCPWCPRGTRARAVLLVQQPVRVVGVRGDAAGARPQRAHDGHRRGTVLGQAVDRAAQLLLDAVHDHRRVGRDRAGVVGDEQRAAARRESARSPPTRPGTSACRGARRAGGRAPGCARSGPTRRRRSPRGIMIRARRQRSAGGDAPARRWGLRSATRFVAIATIVAALLAGHFVRVELVLVACVAAELRVPFDPTGTSCGARTSDTVGPGLWRPCARRW